MTTDVSPPPPDFVTMSRLLRHLDSVDSKRISAAIKILESQSNNINSSSSSHGSGNGNGLSPLRFTVHQSLASENSGKNRYTDIVSYDEALLPPPYLNASLIPSPTHTSNPHLPTYISTQAPLPSTFPTFFHHLISQKVSLVLMLTPLVESGRRKAQQYWPDWTDSENRELDLGQGWRIELISEKSETDQDKGWECHFRRLKVFSPQSDANGYEFDQIHVTSWEDHGSSSQESLKRILNLMDRYSSTSSKANANGSDSSNPSKTSSPILVHCSAGVGRSGTVIASHILRHLSRSQIQSSTIETFIKRYTSDSDNDGAEGEEDSSLEQYSNQLPYSIVKFIRFFRPRMVQTPSQLEMVWSYWREEQAHKP